MTFCVLLCFVKFYKFVFDNIDVRCRELVNVHIRVENVWEKVPKDKPRVLEEGPTLVAKTT